MSKSPLNYKEIREAMVDILEPDEIVEIFGIDSLYLVDTLNNDDIEDRLEQLQDYMPSIDLRSLNKEEE